MSLSFENWFFRPIPNPIFAKEIAAGPQRIWLPLPSGTRWEHEVTKSPVRKPMDFESRSIVPAGPKPGVCFQEGWQASLLRTLNSSNISSRREALPDSGSCEKAGFCRSTNHSFPCCRHRIIQKKDEALIHAKLRLKKLRTAKRNQTGLSSLPGNHPGSQPTAASPHRLKKASHLRFALALGAAVSLINANLFSEPRNSA